MDPQLDARALEIARAAKATAESYDSTFAALTAMLAMNPIVKQLLAAGLTHAHVARTVHLRKQQVGIIARTPFHPLPLATALSVDAWSLGASLWGRKESFDQAVNHALEWDSELLAETAPVGDHAAEYGIVSYDDEISAYQCAYARCHSSGPYTPRAEDLRDLRVGALRATVAGATDDDLRSAEASIIELVKTSIVPEIPNHTYDAVRRYPIADRGKPWLAARFDARAAREAAELRQYGCLRPTLPDDSLDPRVLARDIIVYNFGDARVLTSNTNPETGWNGSSRERTLKEFADELGVRWDQWQTFSPEKRDPDDVEREVTAALTAYLAHTQRI